MSALTNGVVLPKNAELAKDAVMARDLRTLRPIPRAYVVHQIEGREPVAWPIRSPMDMKDREVKALFATDEIQAGEGKAEWEAETERLHARLKLVSPALTDDVLAEMTRTEKLEFWITASRPTAPDPLEELRRILDVARGFALPCPETAVCTHPRHCHVLRWIQDLVAKAEATPAADPLALAPPPESSTLPPDAGPPSAGPSPTPTT